MRWHATTLFKIPIHSFVTLFTLFRYTSGSQTDVCRLVQPRRSVHLVYYHSLMYDLCGPLHEPQVPIAIWTCQKDYTYGLQDLSRVDISFLCGGTPVLVFNV